MVSAIGEKRLVQEKLLETNAEIRVVIWRRVQDMVRVGRVSTSAEDKHKRKGLSTADVEEGGIRNQEFWVITSQSYIQLKIVKGSELGRIVGP